VTTNRCHFCLPLPSLCAPTIAATIFGFVLQRHCVIATFVLIDVLSLPPVGCHRKLTIAALTLSTQNGVD
jgi:hypothetical protein